jgi:hypothetical protein
MRERPDTEPEAHVLFRGMYDQPRERVAAGTPAALPPMSQSLPRNRMGLARWLVDDANPLTSRVVVNRYWQQVFGTGLVKTGEDFGAQGEPPSHPELLDWLASEFRQSGWDTKRFFRLLVTSSTYRQSAQEIPRTAFSREGPASGWMPRWFATTPSRRAVSSSGRSAAPA